VRYRNCKSCGILFAAHLGRRRFCSAGCKALRLAKPVKSVVLFNCVECGTSKVRLLRNQLYCSDDCSVKHRKRIYKAKRRALERSDQADAVNPFVVFRRDKWTCKMCGVRTPRRLRGTCEPNAPEMDHIIPLSAGGAHSYANTQCACRECNNRKGSAQLGDVAA
jgi:hypothetical protein